MSTHNLRFRAKIRKKCIPLYTPRGYTSHGHVILMKSRLLMARFIFFLHYIANIGRFIHVIGM